MANGTQCIRQQGSRLYCCTWSASDYKYNHGSPQINVMQFCMLRQCFNSVNTCHTLKVIVLVFLHGSLSSFYVIAQGRFAEIVNLGSRVLFEQELVILI